MCPLGFSFSSFNKFIGVLEENTKLVLVFVDNARLDRVTNEEKRVTDRGVVSCLLGEKTASYMSMVRKTRHPGTVTVGVLAGVTSRELCRS